MSSIIKHPRFQNDYKKYKEQIDQITNESVKSEAEKLLKELVQTVKRMDAMHLEMIFNKTISTLGTEMRENIIDVRKRLDRLLKETTKLN